MPNNPTWEETSETLTAPTWEDTTPEAQAQAPSLDRETEREDLRRQVLEARAEGIGDKAILGLAELGERAAYTASLMDPLTAIGRVINPYQQTPLPAETVRKAIDFFDPLSRSDVVAGSATEGAKQFGSELISGLAQPEAAAAMLTGKVSPQLPGRLFQPGLIKGSQQAAANLAQAETPAEAMKSGLELGLAIGGTAGIEAHGAKAGKARPTDLTKPRSEVTEAKPAVAEPAPKPAEIVAEPAKPAEPEFVTVPTPKVEPSFAPREPRSIREAWLAYESSNTATPNELVLLAEKLMEEGKAPGSLRLPINIYKQALESGGDLALANFRVLSMIEKIAKETPIDIPTGELKVKPAEPAVVPEPAKPALTPEQEALQRELAGELEQPTPPPPEPAKVAEVVPEKTYGDKLAEELEQQRLRDEAEFKRQQQEGQRKPTTTLPNLVKELGRQKVDELIGDWESDAKLSPDGKSIIGYADPRNQQGKMRVSTKDFLNWYETREAQAKPQTLYHGSYKTDLQSLKPSKFGDFGKGIYLSTNPEFSKQFAESTAFGELSPEQRAARGKGKIYEVELTQPPKKIFTEDNTALTPEELEWWRNSEYGIDPEVITREHLFDERSGRNYGSFEKNDHRGNSEEWDAFLDKFGYDAVKSGEELSVRDPSIVKIKPAAPTAPPAVESKPSAKQPWEMTKAEIVARDKEIWGDQSTEQGQHAMLTAHWKHVKDALSEGKPVPAEVLADYPDLAPKPTPPQPSAGIEKQKAGEGKAASEIERENAFLAKFPDPLNTADMNMTTDRRIREFQKKELKALYSDYNAKRHDAFVDRYNYQLDQARRIAYERNRGITQPPTPGPGAQTVGEPNPPQIEQLTQSFQGIEGAKPTWRERVQEAFKLGERTEVAKDAFSKAVSALRKSGDYLIGKWRGVENIDDLLRAKGQLSAEIETRGWRTRAFLTAANKAIPRQRDQAAIAKWIDAGGDRAELERGMRETKPKYRQAYQDAINLKGDMLVAAQNAQNFFESRLQEAIDAGVLKQGVEDYIHRIYASRPELRDKAIAHVQTGILKANPALARKRVFQFDWEAEKLGYKPVQSFVQRIAAYESSLAKAIASREFIRKATDMKAEDGRPIIDIKGEGIPIEDPVTGERQATLIKPAFNPSKNAEQFLPDGTLNPNYRGDYVNKEFPALSRWKWVSMDAEGKPIFVQGDVAIHPKYVDRITALLEPSRLRYGKYGHIFRPALGISSGFKQTMLDLSGFHQVQITAHGLEHKVLPWKIIKDIDFTDPNVDGLLKGGVTLGGDTPALAAEGLVGSSLTRQIPFLGPLTETYHQWLFQSYIPRIKMTMALHALERNRKRYAGKMTDEQILHKTASQANSAFGELNYTMLERSKTAQDISRLIMLAPDFLEARGRFAAEAFAKGGKSKVPGFGNEQRAALLLGALTMYVTARIANKLLNDQYHFEPENAFSLVHNGRAFSLRTVQGDILHLLERPVQFMMNRLNPTFARTFMEMGTGRDYFGRRVGPLEAVWDNAKNIVPISLRHGRERKLWESMMNSFGFTAKRWSDVDDAFTLAKKWKDANGIGEKGEFIYDRDKDPLRALKLALNYGSEADAATEIQKLLKTGYNRNKLRDYFKRYGTMPFTGSFANDKKWIATLSEDERKTVESAREHKRRIREKFTKAQQIYDAALAAPKPIP